MRGLVAVSKPTDEPANDEKDCKVDLSSPIYHKTPIAAVTQGTKGRSEAMEKEGNDQGTIQGKEKEEKLEEGKTWDKPSNDKKVGYSDEYNGTY